MPVLISRRYRPNSAALSELPRATRTIKGVRPLFRDLAKRAIRGPSRVSVRSSEAGCCLISANIKDIFVSPRRTALQSLLRCFVELVDASLYVVTEAHETTQVAHRLFGLFSVVGAQVFDCRILDKVINEMAQPYQCAFYFDAVELNLLLVLIFLRHRRRRRNEICLQTSSALVCLFDLPCKQLKIERL